MVGRTISHYRVTAELGRGGMGVVYRARDETLGRDVALKLLPAEALADSQARERLIHEARTASALNHPHICTIYEAGEAAGQIFVAMELVRGKPLSQHIRSEGLPAETVTRCGAQMADALDHAHERNVVHRDLKSANVMVTPEGRAKVLDFGLARRLSGDELDEATCSQVSLGEAAGLAGTLPYMAPEQLRGEPADARSDIWALGVVLYEMASGKLPFSGTTGFALSSAILRESPTQLPERVPPGLRAVIQRCLAKEAAQRYQRASEVRAALETLSTTTAAPATAIAAPQGRKISWKWPAAAAVLVVLAVLFALNVGGLRERFFAPSGPPKIESIAVLPLANLSGDPEQEYFVEGMHEALTAELSKVSALKVISRTSAMQYKGAKKPLPQIARELGVNGLIEGSVVREGDQVRITVQLIHGPTDKHLWTETYQRELRGILALQGEVARAIAREIRVAVTPVEAARLAGTRPVNPRAHELYLKGRFFSNRRTPEGFKKAAEHFQQAIALDPFYALAYAGLADNYVLQSHLGTLPPREALPRARAAADRALELDSSLAEPQATLGDVLMAYDWDWEGAERAFRRALELNANHAPAHQRYAGYLSSVGRHEEAIGEIQRAQDLDPLSLNIVTDRAWMHYVARQYKQAEEVIRKALEMDSSFHWAHGVLGYVYLATDRPEKALAAFQKQQEQVWPVVSGNPALAYIRMGRREEARRLVERLEKEFKESYVPAVWVAIMYAHLGEKDRSFTWLENSLEQREPWATSIKVSPLLDPLRGDHRFQALLRRMNFPP